MDAYDRALKLLAMREHSMKELKNKLVSKGYGKEEIEDAVYQEDLSDVTDLLKQVMEQKK